MADKITIEDIQSAIKVFKAMRLSDVEIYDFDGNHIEIESGVFPTKSWKKKWYSNEEGARQIFALLDVKFIT